MPKKSIAKNYLYNLIYQILVMIIPLITTPYLSRVLGAENIGIYSYTISITTYFILFGSLGVAMYGQREIAYMQNDIVKRSKTFFEVCIMRFITLGIALFLFYMSFCLKGEYATYYLILIMEIIANALDISWYFQGLEEFKKIVIRNMLIKLISVFCIFIFIKTSGDLNRYFIIYVFSTFLGNVSLWFFLPSYVKKIKIKELCILKHIKPILILFIPQIATQIYTVLDKTMIGVMVLNKAEVGYYEQAQKIIKLLVALATSLGTVMMPRIAATFATGDRDRIKKYMYTSFSFILLLAFPLMFGIMGVASHFVPLFYGEGYAKVIPILCITSPVIVLIGLSNVIGVQYLLPTKQQYKYTISVIVGALVNFIFNLFLIKNFAAVGASIATVVAELVVTLVQFILIKKDMRIKDILKISYKYFIVSIVMFLCSILIGNLIVNNTLSLILQIFVSVFLYFGLLILMKDQFLLQVIKKNKKNI